VRPVASTVLLLVGEGLEARRRRVETVRAENTLDRAQEHLVQRREIVVRRGAKSHGRRR